MAPGRAPKHPRSPGPHERRRSSRARSPGSCRGPRPSRRPARRCGRARSAARRGVSSRRGRPPTDRGNCRTIGTEGGRASARRHESVAPRSVRTAVNVRRASGSWPGPTGRRRGRTRHGPSGPRRAGRSRTGQSRAGQSWAGASRAGRSVSGPGTRVRGSTTARRRGGAGRGPGTGSTAGRGTTGPGTGKRKPIGSRRNTARRGPETGRDGVGPGPSGRSPAAGRLVAVRRGTSGRSRARRSTAGADPNGRPRSGSRQRRARRGLSVGCRVGWGAAMVLSVSGRSRVRRCRGPVGCGPSGERPAGRGMTVVLSARGRSPDGS